MHLIAEKAGEDHTDNKTIIDGQLTKCGGVKFTDLWGCHNGLTDESHVEEIRTHGEDFYPGPETGAEYATNCSHS